jgi:gamma-D-glutamyl-L-lysine dipeptidyl-peptidase
VYAEYLREMDDAVPKPTHVLIAPAVRLLLKPTAKAAVATCLLCGTAVSVARTKLTWAYVKPTGGMLAGGWMSAKELRTMKSLISPSHSTRGKGKKVNAAEVAKQIIADARRLTGVYYLWGGATPFGLDCSGLVQLTHRLSGYAIPRDAYMQFAKGKPVEPPYQPGDLHYFHSDSDKRRITHVGISLGGWEMIHSSRANNGVYEENVEKAARLRDTFAGARTFIR